MPGRRNKGKARKSKQPRQARKALRPREPAAGPVDSRPALPATDTAGGQAPAADAPEPPTAVRCPISGCETMNAARAEVCAGCDTPLSNHARLAAYPAYLFNRGLADARAGRLARARDLFA